MKWEKLKKKISLCLASVMVIMCVQPVSAANVKLGKLYESNFQGNYYLSSDSKLWKLNESGMKQEKEKVKKYAALTVYSRNSQSDYSLSAAAGNSALDTSDNLWLWGRSVYKGGKKSQSLPDKSYKNIVKYDDRYALDKNSNLYDLWGSGKAVLTNVDRWKMCYYYGDNQSQSVADLAMNKSGSLYIRRETGHEGKGSFEKLADNVKQFYTDNAQLWDYSCVIGYLTKSKEFFKMGYPQETDPYTYTPETVKMAGNVDDVVQRENVPTYYYKNSLFFVKGQETWDADKKLFSFPAKTFVVIPITDIMGDPEQKYRNVMFIADRNGKLYKIDDADAYIANPDEKQLKLVTSDFVEFAECQWEYYYRTAGGYYNFKNEFVGTSLNQYKGRLENGVFKDVRGKTVTDKVAQYAFAYPTDHGRWDYNDFYLQKTDGSIWLYKAGKLKEIGNAEKPAVSSVSLSKKALSMKAGTSYTLKAALYPANVVNKKVTWKTSDPKIAKVVNGKVTALAPGKAVITAVSENKSASCTVYIAPKRSTKLYASSQSTNSVSLKWNKVSGASGYMVYRYDSKAKKDIAIASRPASSNSYKVMRLNGSKGSKLTPGKALTFRVRAFKKIDGKNYYADAVSLTTATKPATVKISSAKKASKTKAKIKWKKAAGASGYQVVMSAKKSSGYKVVKTITKSGTVSYTKTGLKRGKRYYFKVRAYKTVGGKKIYGGYSAVRPVKL